MSMYRKEWECCGDVSETNSWEPESCPFCATPPATTGASAAPANASPVSEREIAELRKLVGHGGVYAAEFSDNEQLMACFWSIIGQINKQLERKPVGASTVLTDERIIASIDTARFADFLFDWHSAAPGAEAQAAANKLIAYIDQHVAREVAAQAGQVAYVPSAVAVPEQEALVRQIHKAVLNLKPNPALTKKEQHEVLGAIHCCAGIVSNFAPSPAKESK